MATSTSAPMPMYMRSSTLRMGARSDGSAPEKEEQQDDDCDHDEYADADVHGGLIPA
jgi:hypothetical protein